MQSGIEGSARRGSSFPMNTTEGDLMTATGAGRADKAFEKVTAQIKARVGGEVYSSWFGRMKVDEYSKGLVRLSVPTAFLRSWINGHYLDLITELWKSEDADALKVEIVVRSATRQARPCTDAAELPAKRSPQQAPMAASPGLANGARLDRVTAPKPRHAEGEGRHNVIGSPLDGRYTFESFIEGADRK